MSGTSIDGIDCSLIYTDGQNVNRTNFNSITPYSKKTKIFLQKAYENPIKFIQDQHDVTTLSTLITIDHAEVIKKIIKKSNVMPLIVGFHGQTILHIPSKKSIQLGCGILLSKLINNNIVYNFRSNDIKFGGQGAPIAPIYHQKIIEKLNLELPSVIINIGGISNLTYWDGEKLIGFDTGPGNNLMDYFMKIKFKKPYDNLGKIASKGQINFNLTKSFQRNIFFKKKPPKSLERQDLLKNKYLRNIMLLDEKDCMATLCNLTADTIKNSFNFLPLTPKNTIIVGGGQKNNHLINLIKKTSISNNIITGDEAGLPSDFIESELIAFLAARKYYSLPSTFPSTTGVKKNTILGDLINIR
jgi:anhydro-N-acetylmuramic acid kinase